MLKDFSALLGRAWERFREEAGRRDPEDQVAELLSGMRREMVDARALVAELKQNLEGSRREAEREQQRLADCMRRRDLAAQINDAETVRVADEFAAKHRETLAVLQAKVQAADAELQLRTREANEMAGRYREAEQRRFTLLAELRRTHAGARMRAEMQGLDDDFDRIGEQIDDLAARADAEQDLERRLAELKRRAGGAPGQ